MPPHSTGHAALAHSTGHPALAHSALTHAAGHSTHAAVTHAAHPTVTHAAHPAHAAIAHAALAGGASTLAFRGEVLARRIALRGLGGAAELLGDGGVAIRDIAPVRSVVPPVGVGDVGAIELVVAERIDVHVPVPPVDAGPDRRAGEDAGAKAPIAAGPIGRIPKERRVVGIRPRAVDDARIVDRHEVLIRIGRRDRVRGRGRAAAGGHVGRPVGPRDRLLRRRLQVAGRIRPRAQPLYRVEHVALLREEGVAEILRPLELVVHHRQRLRNRRQRLDARIPTLLLHGVLERLAGDLWIFLGPARGLDHLERIGRRHQHLRDQGVGKQRDRRDQLLDLLVVECSSTLRLCRRAAEAGDQERDGECEFAHAVRVMYVPAVMSHLLLFSIVLLSIPSLDRS